MKTYFVIVGTIGVCAGLVNQSIFAMFCGVATIAVSLILLGE